MTESEVIKFNNPPNHISSDLIHWTGRKTKENTKESFEIISNIIKTGKLRLGRNHNGYTNKEGTELSVPMVCFTETPLEQSLEHCQTYGYFGIAFNKTKMIEIGANPVLYIVENRKEYQKYFSKIRYEVLLDKWMEWEKTDIPLEIKNNLSWFLSLTQPYRDEVKSGEIKDFFLEREWRIIRALPYHMDAEKSSDKFNIAEITFDCNEKDKSNLPVCYLSFDKSWVKSIIVLKEFKDIAELLIKDHCPNCKLKIVEEEEIKKMY